MPQVRSRYAAIWEQVKATGKCEVAAQPKYHARIRKAVTKRKDEDLAYKLECAEANTKFKLKCSVRGDASTILVFTLTKVIGVDDL